MIKPHIKYASSLGAWFCYYRNVNMFTQAMSMRFGKSPSEAYENCIKFVEDFQRREAL
jgi:hypothetical protein